MKKLILKVTYVGLICVAFAASEADRVGIYLLCLAGLLAITFYAWLQEQRATAQAVRFAHNNKKYKRKIAA